MDELQYLLQIAREAREKAYAPYSQFKVGAALLADDGRVFKGCNVENASYGLTNCAERTAVFKAVSEGCRKFKAIAVVSDALEPCPPCGACLQVIREFGAEIKIFYGNLEGTYRATTIDQLLPGAFMAQSMARRGAEGKGGVGCD